MLDPFHIISYSTSYVAWSAEHDAYSKVDAAVLKQCFGGLLALFSEATKHDVDQSSMVYETRVCYVCAHVL